MTGQQFPFGAISVSQTARAALSMPDIEAALARHGRGEWGALDEADRAANDLALETGRRLLSVFRSEAGARFYVITEWDRSATTVLLPEDY